MGRVARGLGRWLEGIAESKIADFADEAQAADAAVMRDVSQPKRTALLACLIHVAQTRARDELGGHVLQADGGDHQARQGGARAAAGGGPGISERLIENYRELLSRLIPAARGSRPDGRARWARETVEQAGGFDSELSEIQRVAAHHANNYLPLVHGQIGKDRSTMFQFTRTVELEATSEDRSVLDALAHALSHQHLTRDFIPDQHDGRLLDLSFASEQWQRLVRPRRHPGKLDRRAFEACVFTYLAEQLRTGDIAIKGSEAYANWSAKLLSWEECEPLLQAFCAEAGLPMTADEFVEQVRVKLHAKAAEVDAGYPENTDLTIDPDTGRPTLKRRKARTGPARRSCSSSGLSERMPERTVLEMVARTAYWIGWHLHFGPASGIGPEAAQPACPLLGHDVHVRLADGRGAGRQAYARDLRANSARPTSATSRSRSSTGPASM